MGRGSKRLFKTRLDTPILRIIVSTITVAGCVRVFDRVGYVSVYVCMYVYMHPVVNVVITNKGVTVPNTIILLIWCLETEEGGRGWKEKKLLNGTFHNY